MVFTIVTAVFLPMSFIAALFAIPVREFPHASDGVPSLSLGYVSKFVFGIGLAISIPSIAVAFVVDDIRLLVRRAFKRLLYPSRAGKAKTMPVPLHVEDAAQSGVTKQSSDANLNQFQQPVPAKRNRFRLSKDQHDPLETKGSIRNSNDLEKASNGRY